MRLWLAKHDHQAKTRLVETDRDHVRRDRTVHALRLVKPARKPPSRLRNLVRGHPRRELHDFRERLAIAEEAGLLADAPTPPVPLDRVLDLFFEDAASSAELTQAVEVPH